MARGLFWSLKHPIDFHAAVGWNMKIDEIPVLEVWEVFMIMVFESILCFT